MITGYAISVTSFMCRCRMLFSRTYHMARCFDMICFAPVHTLKCNV